MNNYDVICEEEEEEEEVPDYKTSLMFHDGRQADSPSDHIDGW